MAKKSAASKGYRKQTTKKPFLTRKEIILLCAIVAAILVGFILLMNYDDGALKTEKGAVMNAGDNWLIVNGNYGGSSARFFKVGEVGEIEGYTREKQAGSYGMNTPEYVYSTGEEGDPTISVTTYPGIKAVDLANAFSKSLAVAAPGNEVSTVKTGTVGDLSYSWFSYTSQTTPEESAEETAPEDNGGTAASGEAAETAEEAPESADAADEADAGSAESVDANAADNARRTVCAYFDCTHKGSIIVEVVSRGASLEQCADEKALKAELGKAIAAVTLEKK